MSLWLGEVGGLTRADITELIELGAEAAEEAQWLPANVPESDVLCMVRSLFMKVELEQWLRNHLMTEGEVEPEDIRVYLAMARRKFFP